MTATCAPASETAGVSTRRSDGDAPVIVTMNGKEKTRTNNSRPNGKMSDGQTSKNLQPEAPFAASGGSAKYRVPEVICVKFRENGTRGIEGIWDFEPFQPDYMAENGYYKYVLQKTDSPNNSSAETR
jgi:hypothetical protein